MVITVRSDGTEPGLQAVWHSPERHISYFFPMLIAGSNPLTAAPPAKNIERTNVSRNSEGQSRRRDGPGFVLVFSVIAFQISDLLALTVDAH